MQVERRMGERGKGKNRGSERWGGEKKGNKESEKRNRSWRGGQVEARRNGKGR